jgi:tetratricopeptide (TPR) repeat protein
MSILSRLFRPSRDRSPQGAQVAADADKGLDRIEAAIERGRCSEALALANAALAQAPDDPELVFARASALSAWGRSREARDAYEAMVARGLHHERLLLNLGWSNLENGNVAEAERWMLQAGAADPGMGEAHYGLAMVRLRQNRLDEAIEACERALRVSPTRFQYLIGLGLCRLAQNQPLEAEEQFRRAIAADGEQAIGWANLAAALDAQGRDAEVTQALEHAERVGNGKPDDPEAFVDIAGRLFAEGRTRQAIDLLEDNLAHRPSAKGHGKYALALLTAGRLIEGWNQYEFRWLSESLLPYRSDSRMPVWAGQDLAGKTVLLRIEQGFGDAIQFLRYAPLLKALGATTLLVDFSDLAHGFDGVDRVFDGKLPTPEHDYYINLMSLPRAFGSSTESIPAQVPYLRVDPARLARWKGRLGGLDVPKVGLVWAGNPSHLRDRSARSRCPRCDRYSRPEACSSSPCRWEPPPPN